LIRPLLGGRLSSYVFLEWVSIILKLEKERETEYEQRMKLWSLSLPLWFKRSRERDEGRDDFRKKEQ
jgi:hypothetical protein